MEQEVFDLILREDDITWQSLLMDLVKAEGMDPWDINISKIAQSYIQTVHKMKEANLRLSGKVVLASALLLHIKSKHLVGKEMEQLDRLFASSHDGYDENYDDPEYGDVDLLETTKWRDRPKPRLYPKMPQPRRRKVSIHDLVKVLETAMRSKQRIIQKRIVNEVPRIEGKSPVDIGSLIVEVFNRIKKFFAKQSSLTFSQLAPSERRKDRLYTFMPLLHLYNERKIDLNQEKTFGEIAITLASPQTQPQPVEEAAGN